MSKNEIVKILGGLGVILGVFSFLVLSTNFDEATNGAKYAFNGLKNNNYILTNLTKLTGNSGKVSTPPNVVEGFFDVTLLIPQHLSCLPSLEFNSIFLFSLSYQVVQSPSSSPFLSFPSSFFCPFS